MPSSEFQEFNSITDIVYLFSAVGCVICAALAAGMTMGLLSLDSLKLRIKLATGTEKEKKAAQKILPLIENHHLLLCTLLLFNAVSNEALPIFLDAIVPAWVAVLMSVTLVLLCGEILPTALFTGPDQLHIAASFSPLVYFLEFIFYPIAFPMAKGLDYFLGVDEEGDRLNRVEISAMMKILREDGVNALLQQQQLAESNAVNRDSRGGNKSRNSSFGGNSNKFDAKLKSHEAQDVLGGKDIAKVEEEESPLSANEVNVITGVLGLAKKTIADVFVPLHDVNMVSSEQILDNETIEAIENVGNSRLPVFKNGELTHIIGFLRVKKLLKYHSVNEPVKIGTIPLVRPVVVGTFQSLLDVLNIFQAGNSHLALVSDYPDELSDHLLIGSKPMPHCAAIGIVTIEDIFEEMLQSEILDEEDISRTPADVMNASLHLREMSMRYSNVNAAGIDHTSIAKQMEDKKKLRQIALQRTLTNTSFISADSSSTAAEVIANPLLIHDPHRITPYKDEHDNAFRPVGSIDKYSTDDEGKGERIRPNSFSTHFVSTEDSRRQAKVIPFIFYSVGLTVSQCHDDCF